MKCEKARHLIDRRLHDEADGDWSELDAHLAACSACSADWIEMVEARDLLATVADDGPDSEEVDTMWAAIAAGMDEHVSVEESPMRWYDWRVALSGVAMAACLLLAFQLGEIRYGRDQAGGTSLVIAEQKPSLPTVSEIMGKEEATRRGRAYVAKGIHTKAADTELARGDALSVASEGEKYNWYYAGDPVQRGSEVQTKISEDGDLFYGLSANDASDERYSDSSVSVGYSAGSEARRRLESLRYVDNSRSEVHGGSAAISRGTQVERIAGERNVIPPSPEFRDQKVVQSSTVTDMTFGQPAKSSEGVVFGRFRASARGRRAKSADGERMGNDVSFIDDISGEGRPEIVLGVPLKDGVPQSPTAGEDLFADAWETSTDIQRDGCQYGPHDHGRNGQTVEDRTIAWSEDTNDFVVARNFEVTGGRVVEPTASKSIEKVEEQVSQATSTSSSPQLVTNVAPRVETKIIKTGELTVEVETYTTAADQVRKLVGRFNAFVADSSTEELAGGAFRGRIVIRVAPQEFDALFAALKEVGVVESENAKAADVTAEYVDIDARIRGLKITESRLAEIINSKSWMDRMSALLEVEREMTRVRSQIEQLEGQLRVMSDRIALSTITVTIHEPSRTVPSATMSVEVPVLAEAATQLGQSLAELGGKLLAGEVSKHDRGALRGQYTLEVSLARFSEMLQAVSSLGRVERRQVKDQTFDGANAPWALRVQCRVDLQLFERTRDLPSGTMRVEVAKLDSALKVLETVSASAGGSIASSNTTRREDGSNKAEVSLLVPAGRFSGLVAELDRIGRTLTKQVSGEAGRIVGGTAEVLCALNVTLAEPIRQIPSGGMGIEVDNFKASRQMLSSIIKNRDVQILHSASKQRSDGTWVGGFRLGIEAGEMESVVSEIEQLGRVANRDITGLGLGDLSQISPGTIGVIELTLGEKSSISPEPDRADSIRNRLRDGVAGLYASVGMIVYGLMLIAPWLCLTLLAAWLSGRTWRRLATRRRQKQTSQQ